MGRTSGLVLAAGGSRRLGVPKQLLPFGEATLLDAVLDVARAGELDQVVVALGGGAAQVRARVDLQGCDVVVNDAFGGGCASSIAAALPRVSPHADVLVLLLGDMPGVTPAAVRALLDARAAADAPLAACRYADGRRGHPLAFARSQFAALGALHGDRGVWRLLDAAGDAVASAPIAGPVPLDVDTWDDYDAVRATMGR
jgi:molybdenum cofactor cytidylyltransferase